MTISAVNRAVPTHKNGRFDIRKLSKYSWIVIGAVSVYAVLTAWILYANKYVPKIDFDLTPILEAHITVQIHVVAALSTLLIGTILMLGRKGKALHRTLGWTWVVTMTVTAVSSFFITGIFQAHFSPIHALSAWTMISLPMGIAAIRRRDVAKHRKEMTGMFVGAMIIAGLFTFLPGRMMWNVFFS